MQGRLATDRPYLHTLAVKQTKRRCPNRHDEATSLSILIHQHSSSNSRVLDLLGSAPMIDLTLSDTSVCPAQSVLDFPWCQFFESILSCRPSLASMMGPQPPPTPTTACSLVFIIVVVFVLLFLLPEFVGLSWRSITG
ncbi:hypothetical protein HYQ45_004512 [Verticillium longisporum]|uniref:Uncharacterized protein n=1 Tax=Verticillium longisporum TaxID=100787 RepID=A0A8I2ZSY8_VERLO|nr:hypothetical protein HYQ45_004512 [Verticillium longisporum]